MRIISVEMTKNNSNEMQSEGDTNISSRRKVWIRDCIDDTTMQWLESDAKYFLHQSLSTPCLNVLSKCEGIYLEDLQGRRFMDFHGNNVHQVGFANRKVIEAINLQMEKLAFCTRPPGAIDPGMPMPTLAEPPAECASARTMSAMALMLAA